MIILLVPIVCPSFAEKGMIRSQNIGNSLPEIVYRTGWALVIGINKYPYLFPEYQLKYAVADADVVASLLESKFGFDKSNVILLEDEQATREGIIYAIQKLSDSKYVSKEDCVLVYFSGHGQTVALPESRGGGDMGFLIPYDAQVNLSQEPNPAQYYLSCIGMDDLMNKVANFIPAKHVIFILDTCFSGLALEESPRGLGERIPDYLKPDMSLSVTQIITAGRKGEISVERQELGHGVFTYELLQGLDKGEADFDKDGIITGSDLGAYLKNSVPKLAKQTPRLETRGEGDFLFIPQGKVPPPPPPPVPGSVKLVIYSEPNGANVNINGKEIDTTPCTIDQDIGKQGENEVILSIQKEGYREKQEKVELSEDKPIAWINVHLDKKLAIKYPVSVSIASENIAQPNIEDELIDVINEMGYTIDNNAFISVVEQLSVTSERRISGISPKYMVNFNLSVKVKYLEGGETFDAFTATGGDFGSTKEEAIQKGLLKIKIDKTKLSEAIANCQEKIREKRIRLSGERFEEGQKLFRDGQYREALFKLKEVYPETEYFQQAQKLINDIRQIMVKPAIAVLRFNGNSNEVADTLRDILTTMLVQMDSEGITVLEREQISDILKEQNLELDGIVDPATASEFGRLIGADFVLLGRFITLDDSVELNAELVNAGTAQIVVATHTSLPKSKLNMDELAKNIAGEMRNALKAGKLDKILEIQTPIYKDLDLSVMIMIPEIHVQRPVPDPACETEMIRKFVRSGFKVVDQSQVSKIRETREFKAAVDGDIPSAIAIARQYGAQVIIVGEAFSENIPRRNQDYQTCRSRAEARAIDCDTGMILAANGKEAHATDATEGLASKRALRTAGGLLANDMIKQIAETWKSRSELHDTELFVRKIAYGQLISLELFLKSYKGISDIQRKSFDNGIAVIDIRSRTASTQNIASALANSEFKGFEVKIESTTLNTIEVSILEK